MARLSRKSYEGQQLFHVMVQGINKIKIFAHKQEKYEYIKLLKKYSKDYKITILTYCVMDNHVHILIKTDGIKNMTKFMHIVDTSYAIYYNKNNERVGYVYRNRFETQPITDIRYLYNCILYIHNNPVAAGLCNHAKEYKFSSYYKFIEEHNNILVRLFKDKVQYEKAHYKKDLIMYFLEYEEDRRKQIEKEICDYVDSRGRQAVELQIDKELLLPIAKRLKDVYKLSNVAIGKYLNVSREKIRRIL